MNVGELKKLLGEFADDKPVFMSSDEEGNTFYLLDEFVEVPEYVLDGESSPLVLWPGGRPVEEEYA